MHKDYLDSITEFTRTILPLMTALIALYRSEHNGRKIKAMVKRCENFTPDGRCPFAPAKKEVA